MCTDGACDERKRVLVQDDIKRLFKLTRASQLQVTCDILVDRTALLTRRHETVCQGDRLLNLPGRKGFYRLYMMLVALNGLYQGSCLAGVHACEHSRILACKNLADLLQPLITARL